MKWDSFQTLTIIAENLPFIFFGNPSCVRKNVPAYVAKTCVRKHIPTYVAKVSEAWKGQVFCNNG